MRILVIGGTGFIGPHVVSTLVARGHDVGVYHRGETHAQLPEPMVHVLGDRDQLGERISAGEWDVAIHMIAATAQDAWTARLALQGRVEHLVVISSMDVYRPYGFLRGTEFGELLDEYPLPVDGPLRTSLYPYRGEHCPRSIDRAALPPERLQRLDDYDKIPVEQILMASAGMRVTAMRLPMVYGPGDKQHRLHSWLKRMDDGRARILLGEVQSEWRTTRGYVVDVGRTIASAAVRETPGHAIFNVGEGTALTQREWVEAIGQAAGWNGEVVQVPGAELPQHLADDYDYQHHLWCDVSGTKVVDPMGWTDRDVALMATIRWERANPPENIDPGDFDYDAEDEVLDVAVGRGGASN